MVVTSKTIVAVVAVVVTIMVGVVIAVSLGTQDDVPETSDPQPTHTPLKHLVPSMERLARWQSHKATPLKQRNPQHDLHSQRNLRWSILWWTRT